MNPYQYLNTNNNQTADLSYNATAKALIDSLLSGTNVTTKDDYAKAYQRDENGNLTQNLLLNENGQQLYNSGEDTPNTNAGTRNYLNGYEVTPIGNNTYQIGIDDPTTKGMFTLNAQIDPLTNKLSNLGTTYGSNKPFDFKTPAMFAALVGGGLLAAPYLGGASLFGEGALAGSEAVGGALTGAETGGAIAGGEGTVAGDAFLPGSLSSESGALGPGFGSGTSLSADAATNPLNPFYGTANPAAQATLVGSNLVGGGAEANLGLLGGNSLLPVTGAGIGGAELGAAGGIIGSGAGLGQSTVSALTGAAGLNGFTPSDFLSKTVSQPITNDLIDKIKAPSSSNVTKTPQQNMANALRLPTNLDTTVQVYNRQNPFLTNTQQTLANMLKV